MGRKKGEGGRGGALMSQCPQITWESFGHPGILNFAKKVRLHNKYCSKLR